MSLTVTDLFCGAGGSSSGAESVAGVRVRMASNHWQLAIDTHSINLPHVDHDVADIAEVDPRRYPRTDILWASPSCTFWSQARGERQDFTATATEPTLFDLADMADLADELGALPAAAKERSRALMHDVPRFAEHHRYKAVIVENTPELLKWWHFPRWIARMRALGYQHQVLTLNSAFAHQLGAPAPQLRDRVYVAFWQERYARPDFDRWTRPHAWCPTCDRVVTALRAPKRPDRPHGAFDRQYVFRCPSQACRHASAWPYVLPAAAAIDWATPGQRIGDRTRRLAPKTVARIEAGLRRYARPITVEAAGHTFERRPGVRTWPVDQPLRTLHATASKALACPPFLAPMRSGRPRTMPVTDPLATVVADGSNHALLVPVEGRDNITARPAADPADTVAASGNHHGLLMRNNTPRGAASSLSTPTDEPMRTLTTAGHQSLLWHPSLLYAYDTGRLHPTDGPLPTQTTVEGDAPLDLGLDVDDCLFRMLMPAEIKLGMAFAPAFVLLGNQREQVRMCGNAVTPPVARDLIAAVVEAITGDPAAAALDGAA